MLCFSSASLKEVLEEMANVRSCSEDEQDLRIFAVAPCQVIGSEEGARKSCEFAKGNPCLRARG